MVSVRKMLLGLAAGMVLLPGVANAWWNDEWSLRKPMAVDAGVQGANITETVGTLPVLVRLHSGNFKFEAAKEDGSDLRFVAGDDKTPLKFHVEKWDGLLGEAFVWVQVPEVRPGAKTDFWLYYGNSKAPAAEDSKGTFDPNTVLAWHFGERNTPARDWSAWGNASASPVSAADGAMIGAGLKLDGTTPVMVPASPSLMWKPGGQMTWSAWVRPTQSQSNAVLFSRRDGGNALVIGLDNGTPFVEVEGLAGTARGDAAANVPAGTWHHLAVVATDEQMILYVDGAPAGNLAAALPALTVGALIGDDTAAAEPEAMPSATAQTVAPVVPVPAHAAFVGEMDEMRIAKVARPAGFLKAEAIGQGPDGAKLLTLGLDEETASWISGYFAVILGSVTLDGWVVIAILMVMAVISWLVMVDKAVYLSRLEKANDRFLDHFRHVAADLTVLDQGDARSVANMGGRVSEDDQEMVRSSSLYRIYHVGAEEIRHRMKAGSRGLSAESIAAIRAALDSSQVRETQKMNRLMVLLTIAISGGPFLGLLGTVVGVMITFAAIAASGDVNVNAIAPGIAAALVATVAGLGVAIPALFGYNWLLIRVKNSSATMNVFVDELVTKLAEFYRHRADRHAPVSASTPAE